MTSISSSVLKVSPNFILRELSQSDALTIVEQLNTPEIAEWLAAVPQPFEQNHVELLFDIAGSEKTLLYGLEIDGKLTGCLCLGVNTWFWLSPNLWQKGLMQAALRCAIAAYFNNQSPPLYASSRTDNEASRVLLGKLGFSMLPDKKRMYFQHSGKSHECLSFVLTPEQWHLMHPPQLTAKGATIQPAMQRHASELAKVLPNTSLWGSSDLLNFIEKERFRGRIRGLFIVRDQTRQTVGAVLLREPDSIICTFVSREERERYSKAVEETLRQNLF